MEMKELDLEEKLEESHPSYHVLARNLLYPGSHTLRFPVPDEKVPWEVRAGTLGSRAGSRNHGADLGSGRKRNEPTDALMSHLGAPAFPSPGTSGFLESFSKAPSGRRRGELALFLLALRVLRMPEDAQPGARGCSHLPLHFLNQNWPRVRQDLAMASMGAQPLSRAQDPTHFGE